MKKNISIFIVLTLVFQIATAQSDKPTYDSPGNYGDPAIEKAKGKDKEVDFYIPGSRDEDTKKTPNPFGEDMPEGIDGAGDGYTGGQGSDVPDYFTDREFDRSIESGSEISFETFDGGDSGDGEGSEGGQGSHDSGALSGGDFDVGDGKPSAGTSKDKSSSGFGNDFGYENHRGNDEVPKNSQAGRVSRSYPELIEKGRRAARIVENKSSQVRQIRVRIESDFRSAKDAVDQNPAKDFYESGDRTIAGRDLTLEMVKKMAAYKNFSLNDLLVPFSKILMKTQMDFDKYQKKLIADELDKNLPGLRQKNLGSLIRSREMIKNWKIAQAKIKEALFNDLFDQTQTATQNLEDQMNLNYMGTFDAKFADFLKNQELQGRYRLSEYISSFLTEINPYQNGAQQVPQGLQEAIKLLKEADDIVRNNGDMFVAADKILQAKESLSFVSGETSETVSPLDIYGGAKMAGMLGKGLIKYGFKSILKDLVTIKARSDLLSTISRLEKFELEEALKEIKNVVKRDAVRKMIAEHFKMAGGKVDDITALGHTPEYKVFADAVGAKRFYIKPEIWDKMTSLEKDIANFKFLDRAALRRDRIRLTTRVQDVYPGGQLEKEIRYMTKEKWNYHISSDGWWLLP